MVMSEVTSEIIWSNSHLKQICLEGICSGAIPGGFWMCMSMVTPQPLSNLCQCTVTLTGKNLFHMFRQNLLCLFVPIPPVLSRCLEIPSCFAPVLSTGVHHWLLASNSAWCHWSPPPGPCHPACFQSLPVLLHLNLIQIFFILRIVCYSNLSGAVTIIYQEKQFSLSIFNFRL